MTLPTQCLGKQSLLDSDNLASFYFQDNEHLCCSQSSIYTYLVQSTIICQAENAALTHNNKIGTVSGSFSPLPFIPAVISVVKAFAIFPNKRSGWQTEGEDWGLCVVGVGHLLKCPAFPRKRCRRCIFSQSSLC